MPSPRTRVISLLSFGLTFWAHQIAAQCVECDSNKAVLPGHGPASALPNHPDPTDNRRVIRVVINNLGNTSDPTSWYDPTANGPNAAILGAVQTAADRWNNATDQYGNRTGYFFHVSASQTAQDLANADIIVE